MPNLLERQGKEAQGPAQNLIRCVAQCFSLTKRHRTPHPLRMLDFAASVFFGNVLTLSFVWACVQFHRHDYQAPWLAYAAFLMPLIYLASSIVLTEGLPPQFDGIALR